MVVGFVLTFIDTMIIRALSAIALLVLGFRGIEGLRTIWGTKRSP